MRVRAMITTIAGIIGGFTAATLDTPWWVNLAIGTALTWFVCVLFPDSPNRGVRSRTAFATDDDVT